MTAGRLLLRAGKRDAWSPYNMPLSQVGAWYRAQDHASTVLMTDDGAGLISSWKDARAFIAATGTLGTRPTWAAASFNAAFNGVTADGIANTLLQASTTGLVTGTSPGFIGLAATSANDGSTGFAVTYGGTGAGTFRQIRKNTANNIAMSDGNTTVASSVNWSTPAIVVAVFDVALYSLYINGTLAASSAGSPVTGTTRLRLFASSTNTAANFFNGTMAETLIGNVLPSTLLRQQYEGYLAWTYGLTSVLPSDHPYKLVPP